MPRNGSGVYSQPAGTTAIPNNVISSSAFNTLMMDIGTALTGSVARDGSSPMLAPLQLYADPTSSLQAATKHYVDTSIFLNIRNYGADNTGTADCTALFQQAINDLAAASSSTAGAGILYVPAGTYLITGALAITTSFITIQGEGQQATYLKFANGNQNCITIGSGATATRQQCIRDLGMFGSSKSAGIGAYILNCFNVLLERVQIEGMDICVDVGPSNNGVTLRDMYMALGPTSFPTGINWHAAGDGSSRADVLSIYNVVIEGNWTDGTGLRLDGSVNTLVGCTLRILHMKYGIYIRNTAASNNYYPQFTNLFDVELEGFKTRALLIEGGSDIRIVGSDINNLSGATSQGNADAYAIEIQPDTGHSETHSIIISETRIGNCRDSGIFANARNVQLTAVVMFSTSLQGSGSAAAISVGPLSRDFQYANVIAEEYGGAGRASYAIAVASGALRTNGVNLDATNCVTGAVSDASGDASNTFLSTVNIDGTITHYSLPVFRRDQNAVTTDILRNKTVGASSAVQRTWDGATANSFATQTLADNNGVPTFSYAYGSAVGTITMLAGNGGTRITMNNTGIGFLGATPVGRTTVTGSRGGNAALASLLTAMAVNGLITDSST